MILELEMVNFLNADVCPNMETSTHDFRSLRPACHQNMQEHDTKLTANQLFDHHSGRRCH